MKINCPWWRSTVALTKHFSKGASSHSSFMNQHNWANHEILILSLGENAFKNGKKKLIKKNFKTALANFPGKNLQNKVLRLSLDDEDCHLIKNLVLIANFKCPEICCFNDFVSVCFLLWDHSFRMSANFSWKTSISYPLMCVY